jgi:hypothetical protein
MKIGALLFVCTALVVCIPAWADPIGYTETFNSGSNMDWGTDSGWWFDEFFSANYDEDGASHSNAGGYTGGYNYTYQPGWTYYTYSIFADSDASNGLLAGNKDYSTFPRLEACVRATSGYGYGWIDGGFFFASTGDSSTNPVGAANLTMFMTYIGMVPSDWAHWTADLTPSQWWLERGSADWSSAISDVDVVGVWFWPEESEDTEFGVDDFVGTPEPGLLLSMAPVAGFLGWRLRRRRQPNRT